MCVPAIPLAIGLSAAAGVGSSLISANAQKKAAKQAASANEAAAQRAAQGAQAAEQQSNRLNQKMPGLAGLFAGNKNATSRGLGSTFLTGPAGVGALPLGGVSLLGQ